MVTMGHCCDITPLLTSLASSEGFDICVTESVVVIGVVIADSTDVSHFAPVVRDLAIDLVVSPQAA